MVSDCCSRDTAQQTTNPQFAMNALRAVRDYTGEQVSKRPDPADTTGGTMGIRRPILNAIEQLSQTVLKPATWPAALDAAVSLLGGDRAILLTNKQSAMTLPLGVFAGLD